MATDRLSWDEFWFLLAMIYSIRATCDRRRIGTVVVFDKHFVGAGYNGSPPGAPHCDDVGHLIIEGHCERTIHSEANAIINTERSRLKGATVYTLVTPCIRCLSELISAGVKEIHYLTEYNNARGMETILEICKQSGVRLIKNDYDPQDLFDKALSKLKEEGGILHS